MRISGLLAVWRAAFLASVRYARGRAQALHWGAISCLVVLLVACGGGGGGSTADDAQLAPSVVTEPSDVSVVVGNTATFTVVAAGSGPLSYQWQANGSAIAGANSPSHTTSPTIPFDSGTIYSVVVTNAAGVVTSKGARLTVTPVEVAPTITRQPADLTVNEGQSASLSVDASGTAPFTYQWFRNGAAITGANLASYATPPATAADNGAVFQVIIANNAGQAVSGGATLTVTPLPIAPSIVTQPASVNVNEGHAASFSVAATGSAPLGYQWLLNGVPLAGATSSTYTLASASTMDSGALFSVVVSNAAGSETSNAATLTVGAQVIAPTIVASPTTQTVTEGMRATFSVVATGTAPLTYQWQLNGSPIGGATSDSYTTPATTAADNSSTYSVSVSNAAGTANSGAAVLYVGSPPPLNGEALARSKNCMACHAIDRKLVGPSFRDVAAHYRGSSGALEYLSLRIRTGGSGVWGAIPMPSNSQVSEAEADQLANWVLTQ